MTPRSPIYTAEWAQLSRFDPLPGVIGSSRYPSNRRLRADIRRQCPAGVAHCYAMFVPETGVVKLGFSRNVASRTRSVRRIMTPAGERIWQVLLLAAEPGSTQVETELLRLAGSWLPGYRIAGSEHQDFFPEFSALHAWRAVFGPRATKPTG